MWKFLLRHAGLSPNLERRVTALEVARRAQEGAERDRDLRHEADINMISLSINGIRAEIESERKERFAMIMEAFSQAAESIITRVLASTRGEFGIGRAEMSDLKSRVRNLEVRGEDGE